MYITPEYLALIVVTLLIGCGATWWVNHQLKKYTQVRASIGIPGAEMARRMLASHGIYNVEIRRGAPGQDHFDPRDNSITLDPEAYSGASITAIATACHEAGHAVQFAQGYSPMKVRSALVPVVNLASNAWMFVLIIGFMLANMNLVTLAIVLYALAVVFQLVTLPVEFNASRRAMNYLSTSGVMAQEQSGAWAVLRACALTYVAAALTSLLQLLYLLSLRRED